jgi:hypothetical protein
LFKVGTGLATILFPSVCNAVAINVTPGGIEWQSKKTEGLICAGNNEELMQARSLFLSATS